MGLEIVKTEYGTVKGIAEGAYTIFKGIPYAKAPVGELRWRAPQPPESFEGIYEAVEFPYKSMQEDVEIPEEGNLPFYVKEFHDDPSFEAKISEDSLYLNIWTPARSEEEQLPVVLWIHGGAFSGGYGHEKEFDGAAYCERGVILVSINYRLNLFGFLAHPWLNEEDEHHVSGNYGILDQIAALKWVYRNIHAFGGNPDNITIMGQSAGALSVQTLVSSPLTENMISKAIMQSGGGYDNGLLPEESLEEAMEIGEHFVKLTGAKTLQELRAKTSKELYDAYHILQKELHASDVTLLMRPVTDGYVLEKTYAALVENREVKKIPYLLGATRHDIFVPREEADAGVMNRLQMGCVNWCSKLEDVDYPSSYVYHFRRELPGDTAGAFHSAELWYMFGTLGRCWRPMTEDDFALSREMLSCWTNFAKTGNPNGNGPEEWKPCTKEQAFIKTFDI
jgi:para-nitrobenzyl esterase